MGGNAFGANNASRMTREEAIDKGNRFQKIIEKRFGPSAVIPLHFPVDKESYGDIDIIFANDNPNSLKSFVGSLSEAEDRKMVGQNQGSVLWEGVQVDLFRSSEEGRDLAYLNSMHSFLGGFLSYAVGAFDYKLKKDEVQNSRYFTSIGKPIVDTVTRRPEALLDALDLPIDIIDVNLTGPEVIEMISRSNNMPDKDKMMKSFQKSIQKTTGTSYSHKMIEEAITSVKETGETFDVKKQRFIQAFVEHGYNPDETPEKVKQIEDNKKKYNASLVTEWTGATKKDLGTLMRNIAKTFDSKDEMEDFITHSSQDDIKKMVIKQHVKQHKNGLTMN